MHEAGRVEVGERGAEVVQQPRRLGAGEPATGAEHDRQVRARDEVHGDGGPPAGHGDDLPHPGDPLVPQALERGQPAQEHGSGGALGQVDEPHGDVPVLPVEPAVDGGAPAAAVRQWLADREPGRLERLAGRGVHPRGVLLRCRSPIGSAQPSPVAAPAASSCPHAAMVTAGAPAPPRPVAHLWKSRRDGDGTRRA